MSVEDQNARLLFLERTHLAWNRTALAFVFAAGLLVRLGYEAGAPAVGWAVGGADVLLAGIVWIREDRMPQERLKPSPRVLRLLAFAVLFTAVTGIGLALAEG